MNRPLTVGALVARLQRGLPLEQIGAGGLDRQVTSADVSSPGLVLAGYVERFPAHRLQAFGETEIASLHSLTREERERILRDMRDGVGAIPTMGTVAGLVSGATWLYGVADGYIQGRRK